MDISINSHFIVEKLNIYWAGRGWLGLDWPICDCRQREQLDKRRDRRMKISQIPNSSGGRGEWGFRPSYMHTEENPFSKQKAERKTKI